MIRWNMAGNAKVCGESHKREKYRRAKHKCARKCRVLAAGMMALAVLAGALAGCGGAESGDGTKARGPQAEESQEQDTQGQDDQEQDSQAKKSADDGSVPEAKGSVTAEELGIFLDPGEEYAPWEESSAVRITLADSGVAIDGQGAKAQGGVVTIDRGGTYVLKGTLSDGTIFVDAGQEDKVRLVFDGVDIHSETSAAVDIKKAGQTIISLEAGTVNSLSDSSGVIYRNKEKEEPNATLFCKDDLIINGSGTLRINASFNNGICSKDTLKIVDGVYEITAANHGVKGNDQLAVYGGQMRIEAAGDGLKSDILTAVVGGEIVISDCDEGLEAETVAIFGGIVDLTARDDGINASADGNQVPKIYFAGGEVTVRAEGDGIDSNGSVYMSGGQVSVYGPSGRGNGAIDYDREFELTGGALAAFGPGGMDLNVSSSAFQVSVLADFQESQEAGTEVVVRDKNGKELYQGAGEKAFRTVVISVPEMEIGGEYEIEAGGSVISFAPLEGTVYVNQAGIQEAAAMNPGRGGPGGMGGRMRDGQTGERMGEWNDEWKDGERPRRPEGWEDGERPGGWDGGGKPERPEGWNGGERPKVPEGREDGGRGETSEG